MTISYKINIDFSKEPYFRGHPINRVKKVYINEKEFSMRGEIYLRLMFNAVGKQIENRVKKYFINPSICLKEEFIKNINNKKIWYPVFAGSPKEEIEESRKRFKELGTLDQHTEEYLRKQEEGLKGFKYTDILNVDEEEFQILFETENLI